MNEIWKPITGYEGQYEASNEGNIRSVDRQDSAGRQIKGRPIKQYLNKKGYKIVRLSIKGKKKEERVHRLVLLAFSPIADPTGVQVNHKDGNKQNNKLKNLEWCTAKHNIQHSHAMGLAVNPSGEQHGNSILSKKEVQEIFNRAWNYEPIKALAKEYNCHPQTIRNIQMRKTWVKDTKTLTHEEEDKFLEEKEEAQRRIEEYHKHFS